VKELFIWRFSQNQLDSSNLDKGMFIKDVRSQARGGLSSADIFRALGESSDADVRTFWSKNSGIFRNLWCVRTDKEGVEPVRTFFGEGSQFFAILCRRLLWTAPKQNQNVKVEIHHPTRQNNLRSGT